MVEHLPFKQGVEGSSPSSHTIKHIFAFANIDNLFKKYNVAKQNGIYYKVSGLPSFYGLKIDVTYDSGENLYCYNNQDLIFLTI